MHSLAFLSRLYGFGMIKLCHSRGLCNLPCIESWSSRCLQSLFAAFPKLQRSHSNRLRMLLMQDGTSKMSKSAESDASRINLLDPSDVLASKIKRAKTDGEEHLSECCTATTSLQAAAGCVALYAIAPP